MGKDFGKIEEKIDKLASATTRGFEKVDKKFEKVDKKFEEKIDTLAIMVQRGFEETATKVELNAVETRLGMRLDRIENILLRDHNNRIERIEDKLMQVEVLLGQRFK